MIKSESLESPRKRLRTRKNITPTSVMDDVTVNDDSNEAGDDNTSSESDGIDDEYVPHVMIGDEADAEAELEAELEAERKVRAPKN